MSTQGYTQQPEEVGFFSNAYKTLKDKLIPPTPPYTPTSTYTSTTPTSTYTSTTPSSVYGGKNKGRKRSRKMRGGAYVDNIALTGYAASAASVSGGGKRRTKKCRRNKYTKSCKKRRR